MTTKEERKGKKRKQAGSTVRVGSREDEGNEKKKTEKTEIERRNTR